MSQNMRSPLPFARCGFPRSSALALGIRRLLLAIMACIAVSAAAASLPVATPEEEGIDSARLEQALQAIVRAGWPVDSVLVMRHGRVVLDSYFYPFAPGMLHDLRSVTKSHTSTLLGLSLQQGKLGSLQQKVLPFFPEAAAREQDARKQAMTLEHLVDMRSGLLWDEGGYGPDSSLARMMASADWLHFVLVQEMAHAPGEVFNYNGGNMNMLSAIIGKSWGQPMREVVRTQLFAPLGIGHFTWWQDPQGNTEGEAGLALSPPDMARMGQLWLDDGVWQGQRLLPPGWTASLLDDALPAFGDTGYRRGFWINRERTQFAAKGRHGQFILVEPARQLVIVLTGKFPEDRMMPDVGSLFSAAAGNVVPLSANPQAQRALQATVQRLAAPPASDSRGRERGKSRYGQRWELAANPLGIKSMRLLPDSQDAGAIIWEVEGSAGRQTWPVGLDGIWRFRDDVFWGQPLQLALRGTWRDGKTLEIRTQYPEHSMSWTYRMTFAGSKLQVEVADNQNWKAVASGALVK